MIYYCPACWAEVPEGSDRCPACGQSLAAGGEDFVDKLIAALRHPEPTRAAVAIQILSEMLAEPRAIQPLIDLLGTARGATVLRCAVVAPERFADRRAVPALSGLLLAMTTPLVVRTAAVDALAHIGGGDALADPNSVVRERAAGALSGLQGQPAAASEDA